MKRILLTIICLTLIFTLFAQIKNAKEYGFTHLNFSYRGDKVDILIKSKKGEETLKKTVVLLLSGEYASTSYKIL